MLLQGKLEAVARSLSCEIQPAGQAFRSFYLMNGPHHERAVKRVVYREFTPKSGSVTIVPISDAHLGHKNCKVDQLAQYFKMIDSVEDCYTVLLGDQAETATKTSVGLGMFEEKMHLPDQLEKLAEILHPLAQKGKVLGMIPGNHEFRIHKELGINPMEQLADMLDIDYMGHQGFLDLRVNGIPYQVMVFHGVGGGGSTGGKLNGLERLGNIAIADLYLAGHTHIRSYHDDCIYEIKDGELVARKRYYVTCGSFLDYWNGYPEMKGLRPVNTGSVGVELRGDVKGIQVTII